MFYERHWLFSWYRVKYTSFWIFCSQLQGLDFRWVISAAKWLTCLAIFSHSFCFSISCFSCRAWAKLGCELGSKCGRWIRASLRTQSRGCLSQTWCPWDGQYKAVCTADAAFSFNKIRTAAGNQHTVIFVCLLMCVCSTPQSIGKSDPRQQWTVFSISRETWVWDSRRLCRGEQLLSASL